jgi:hypothetical protein
MYVRALLRNEPFVITVDTSVRVTMELLLLPMQRSIRSVSMEVSLLDSRHVTLCIIINLYFLLASPYRLKYLKESNRRRKLFPDVLVNHYPKQTDYIPPGSFSQYVE